MIQPNITHLPCDLNQQRKRDDARRDSLARAVQWRRRERTASEGLFRRRRPGLELTADATAHSAGEDVFHAFSV
ncbi:MAG TPA: hypothetical protein VEC15_07080 [Actinomycetota bacterium]|nr:hypothetical protein [Actinomycetota bacterium]